MGEVVRITDATGAQLVHQTDAFGNLVGTKDALQNTIAIAFDIRGHKLSITDPDAGVALDCYDALGQLVAFQYANMRAGSGALAPAPTTSTTAAPSATAGHGVGWTQAYDVLGRTTQRIEPEFTSAPGATTNTPTHQTCNKGELASFAWRVTSAGINRKVVYDALGRPLNVLATTGTGQSFASAVSTTRPRRSASPSMTYPTGLQVGYAYTALGYPEKMLLNTAATVRPLAPPAGGVSSGGAAGARRRDAAAGRRCSSVNAWGAIEKQGYSNGVITTSAYEAATGRVTDLKAGASARPPTRPQPPLRLGQPQATCRRATTPMATAATGAVTETFNYADGLNRLTGYTVAGASIPSLSRTVLLQYNALGMLLYKSDVGNYVYGAQGATAAPCVRTRCSTCSTRRPSPMATTPTATW